MMRDLRSTLLASLLSASAFADGQTPAASPKAAPQTPVSASAPASPVAPSPEPAVAPPDAGVEAPPSLPKKLTVGTDGFFQPSVLLQGWFVVDSATETSSTFRLRRAELGVKGEIVSGRMSYGLVIDPAKILEFQDKAVTVSNQDPAPTDPSKAESVTTKQPVSPISMLQDVYISVLTSYVDVTIGQFKIPVSWEGLNSSSKLLFPERSLVSREFGDRRDLGIRASKTFQYFAYSAAIYNGAGQNNLDTNNDKDLALRVEGYPLPGLTVAGVAYTTVGERRNNVKERYEGDVRYERGPFLFQAEYIRAFDLARAAPGVDAQGFYGAFAWTFQDMLQPVVRVGFLDPDIRTNVDPITSGGRDEVWQIDVGLNYYFRKNEAKIQLVYSRFQFETRTPSNQVILSGQIAF